MKRLTCPGKLFVTVGLPGAGKTTRAKQLEAEFAALRLTPDEWMIPLFDHNDADGRRDVVEGRFVWLAMKVFVRWASDRWPTSLELPARDV